MPRPSLTFLGHCPHALYLAAALLLPSVIIVADNAEADAVTATPPQWVPLRPRVADASAVQREKLQFEREIRPILAENCFGCHGPEKGKGGLHLNDRKSALASGAIVPGQPDQSALVKRVFATDPADLMPPPVSHKTLTAEQKDTLKRWIAEGAAYGVEVAGTAPAETKPTEPQVAPPVTKPVAPTTKSVVAKPARPTTAGAKTAIGKSGVPASKNGIVAATATGAGQAPTGKLLFNRDVRPILSESCFLCHGPNKTSRKADLRLDDRATAVAKGAIVPGRPDESELVKRIFATDPANAMPPADSHRSITAAQRNILRQWIAQGAEYQPQWSFIPPAKAPLPPVSNPKWVRNPIDSFIEATLDRHGLKPSLGAPKETLLRRVTLDLTGLPPTPAEVDAFLADKSPNAYENVVDRLLASPRYGEHMATYWLDAVRYSDTHGLHFDNERAIWPYRDWVVKAFNDNMPYDQFTIEQLAGDLLTNPTRDQLVATGFIRCSPTSNEGGSISEELLFRYAEDRTETTSAVFLGLTAGCAVCHDHKFDPISQKEFYQLYAFYNSAADPAFDGNDVRTPPVLKLSTPEQDAQLVQYDKDIGTVRDKIKTTVAKLDYKDPALQTPLPPTTKLDTVWVEDNFPPDATPHSDGNATTFITADQGPVQSGQRALKKTGDGTIQDFFDKLKEPFKVPSGGTIFAYTYLDPKNPPKAIMLQFNTGDWTHRVNWGDADAIPFGEKGTVAKIQGGALPKLGEWARLEIKVDDLQLKPGTKFSGLAFTQSSGTVYWDHIGVSYDTNPASDPELSQHAWQKKYTGKDPGQSFPQDVRDIFKGKAEERNPEQVQRLHEYYLSDVYSGTREAISPMLTEIAAVEDKKKKLDAEVPVSLIMAEMPKPREAHLMIRGQYDKPGEVVEPNTPACLPPLKAQGRATRLDLAKWLVSPEHPLTSRVYVNRLWQQCFGMGLIKSAGDFGAQGEPPSHPELLDWLAVDFREHGWDIKRMMKLMVTSATYRQDSRVTPQLRELDPDNRLLARGSRIRLDAEEVRDNALYVSGLIDLTMGGRGVRTYQPVNIWEPLAYPDSNTAKYVQDHGSALYRRSIYMFWKRTAPHPALSAFDAPNRESYCLRRERSNTPLQALVLMNDVQHFEAARALAQRTLSAGGTKPEDRLAFDFRVVTARYPTARERSILKADLDKQLAHFKAKPDAAKQVIVNGESTPDPKLDPVELAAYTMVSSLILNLDETVTRN